MECYLAGMSLHRKLTPENKPNWIKIVRVNSCLANYTILKGPQESFAEQISFCLTDSLINFKLIENVYLSCNKEYASFLSVWYFLPN